MGVGVAHCRSFRALPSFKRVTTIKDTKKVDKFPVFHGFHPIRGNLETQGKETGESPFFGPAACP
jgi:hypothetical protein